MTLIVACPSCSRKLRVPDNLMGMMVKCPSCSSTFTARGEEQPALAASVETTAPPPAPLSAPPESPSAPPEDNGKAAPPEDNGKAEPTADSDRRPCPACGQSIALEATRCRFCGEPAGEPRDRDDGEDRPWERRARPNVRRDCEPHRGALVLVLGILSIVFGVTWLPSLIGIPVGIFAWVMGHNDLRKMRQNQMDPSGEGNTRAGFVCGIIGTVISSLFGLCCLGYVAYMVVIGIIIAGVAANPPPAPGGPPPTPGPRRFFVPEDHLPRLLPIVFPRASLLGQAPLPDHGRGHCSLSSC